MNTNPIAIKAREGSKINDIGGGEVGNGFAFYKLYIPMKNETLMGEIAAIPDFMTIAEIEEDDTEQFGIYITGYINTIITVGAPSQGEYIVTEYKGNSVIGATGGSADIHLIYLPLQPLIAQNPNKPTLNISEAVKKVLDSCPEKFIKMTEQEYTNYAEQLRLSATS